MQERVMHHLASTSPCSCCILVMFNVGCILSPIQSNLFLAYRWKVTDRSVRAICVGKYLIVCSVQSVLYIQCLVEGTLPCRYIFFLLATIQQCWHIQVENWTLVHWYSAMQVDTSFFTQVENWTLMKLCHALLGSAAKQFHTNYLFVLHSPSHRPFFAQSQSFLSKA